jgi:hypothetical protein
VTTAPCTVEVVPLDDGGVDVTLSVTTYEGVINFKLTAERDKDGDWNVHLPWPTNKLRAEPALVNGIEVYNGIAYLGAPDDEPSAQPPGTGVSS